MYSSDTRSAGRLFYHALRDLVPISKMGLPHAFLQIAQVFQKRTFDSRATRANIRMYVEKPNPTMRPVYLIIW